MNEEFQNHTKVFTDGSKDEHGVGCAFTIPDRNVIQRYSLNRNASIFHAELYAILQALITIIEMCMKEAVVVTDSLSSIQAIMHMGHSNPLVQKIQGVFSASKADIKFFWCPSHVGIAGNETAFCY
uniref:RNase H type-1 domain-containing protein n=1 Tax=Cacopsylla melanoneura TaxID=428564 RepID=A0A8D8V5V0_9HEMI